MKKCISILVLLLLLFPCLCFAGNLSKIKAVIAAKNTVAGCNESIDFIGSNSEGSTAAQHAAASVQSLNLWEPSCSGKLKTAYLKHYTTNNQSAKIVIYLDDGDNVPDSGDTLIEASYPVTSSTTEWISVALAGTNTVSTANKYWVGFITGGGVLAGWNRYYSDGLSNYYQITDYSSPPGTLAGTWSSTANRQFSMYITIGQ